MRVCPFEPPGAHHGFCGKALASGRSWHSEETGQPRFLDAENTQLIGCLEELVSVVYRAGNVYSQRSGLPLPIDVKTQRNCGLDLLGEIPKGLLYCGGNWKLCIPTTGGTNVGLHMSA